MARISARRLVALTVVPILLLCGAVFASATVERDSAIHAGQAAEASQQMLTAMLDQETGARGYFAAHDSRFLQPWYTGTSDFATALARSRSLAGTNATLRRRLTNELRFSTAWHAATRTAIDVVRATGRVPTVGWALQRKATMDDFRAANASVDAQLRRLRDHGLSVATGFAVALAAGLSTLFVIVGLLLARRIARIERERQTSHRELRELLQVSDSEDESRMLLIRHVERIVPGSGAVVLNRNNSDDRLEPIFNPDDELAPLRGVNTDQLQPRSCMAVRLSHSYERRPGDDPLLRCEVCGKIEADVVCEPLLVAGQVIGSVLVTRQKPLAERHRSRVRDSVLQAAPILANQRNLALAETRAASDALTGLPNRRAADDTLKRMVAHAGRAVSPLAAVLLDLDHFKTINDVHGHDQGDATLASVGHILHSTLRASDFAARYGGEEFLILMPDTDREGAVEVAERIRVALEQAEISGVGSVTASLGVAVLPDDALDTEQLIRKADRALYAAKNLGRNRVETEAPLTETVE